MVSHLFAWSTTVYKPSRNQIISSWCDIRRFKCYQIAQHNSPILEENHTKPSTTSYLPSYIRQNGECSTKIGAIYIQELFSPPREPVNVSNVMAQCSKLQASDHAASPYMVRDLHCRWIRVFIGRFAHVLNTQSQSHMHFRSKYTHMLIISSQR